MSKKNNESFVFDPGDYNAASKALAQSKEQSISWNNSGYHCNVETCNNGEDLPYYDVYVPAASSGETCIMFNEEIVLLGKAMDDGYVRILVPNDESEEAIVSKSFFEKNFVKCTL